MWGLSIFLISTVSFIILWLPLPVPFWIGSAIALSALSLNIKATDKQKHERRLRRTGNLIALATCGVTATFYLMIYMGLRLL
ncbi:MAG: hypothetical protein JXR95_02935 [Deltaproteobacteria bacterium]|nr:hypothetical protein [Deltaproteobacteria bacterium]